MASVNQPGIPGTGRRRLETRDSESSPRRISVTSHLQECSVNYTIIDPGGLKLNVFRLSFEVSMTV